MANRCGILTFNAAINYGAVFQMFALERVLNDIGVEAEVINYQPEFMYNLYRKREIKDWLNLKTIYHTLFSNSYVRYNIDGFSNFIKNNIRLSPEQYHNGDELQRTNDRYDCFIAGSDQVFNLYCSNFDENYFLTFVNDYYKRNSYAASLGLDSIPDEQKEIYKKLLCGFNNISIREKTGADVIEKLIGKKCRVNIDPTLLLTKEDWLDISDKSTVDKNYILVYVLSEDPELFSFARKIANINNCEVLYINDRLFGQKKIRSLRKVNPETWLSLFLNARAVVTNSFHGIAFSVNFEKNFYPFLLNKNTRVNSRIKDFLDLNHLEYLLNVRQLDTNLNSFKVDYQESRMIIERERKAAREYLTGVVS